MEILNPWALILLIFIPLFLKHRKLNTLKKITVYSQKNYFFLVAFLLLVTALCRPVINNGYINVKLPKTNVIIGLDISKHMQKNDFYPNNLEFAKNKFSKFVKYLNYEPVSLLLFDKDVYLLSPLSSDYNSVVYLLKHIPKIQTSFYPDFYNLIKTVDEFKNPKVLVIFTNSTASKKALEEAKNKNLKVFIYFIGKQQNKAMENFAMITNGGIVYASYLNTDIKNLASMINSINKKRVIKIKDKKELFYYPLFFGILFIFLALFKGRR
jgi:Ca-activated chloride channel family protein